MTAATPSPDFAALLHDYFCQRPLTQRNASPRTIASYRDTFRLLLRYVQEHTRTAPVALTLADLDAPLILTRRQFVRFDCRADPVKFSDGSDQAWIRIKIHEGFTEAPLDPCNGREYACEKQHARAVRHSPRDRP